MSSGCSPAQFLGGFNHNPRFANLTLAGLEMALWDIIGKAAGRPVTQLLGGACHEQIDYFGFLQGDTAEELAEDARDAVAAGYSVIYMKVGRGEKKDLSNVAAVREVIGDKLRLDANEAWDPRTAIYMINRLACFEPEFVEQPTPAQSIAALRQVKESVPVPIAADQCVHTPQEVYEVCRQRAADLIVLSFTNRRLLSSRSAIAGPSVTGLPWASVTGCWPLQHQADHGAQRRRQSNHAPVVGRG
jgi:muconate cycloisomerase